MKAKLPSPLISENEGKHLADLHEHTFISDPNNEIYYMPRTSDELEALYEYYKSGQVKYKESPLICLWLVILDGILKELKCRCKDGIKPLIDEYIQAIGDFLRITDDFHDQSFLEQLYDNFSGFLSTLHFFIMHLNMDMKSNPDLTWDNMQVPYTVSKINDLLAANSHFKHWNFKEFFETHYLTDEFKNSAEYKMIHEAIDSDFKNGVSFGENDS